MYIVCITECIWFMFLYIEENYDNIQNAKIFNYP